MPTQGERRALMFLAAVAVLGAGTRAWRARRVAAPDEGLAAQIGAVDSAKERGPRGRNRRPANPSTRQPANVSLHQPAAPVDLDTASAAAIERLPGIGPALARRIVSDRDANGPFGCLAALDRVKGIGPALLARLDSLATFSAARGGPCGPSARGPEG